MQKIASYALNTILFFARLLSKQNTTTATK